ncbi:MAG: hypothetical protein KIS62_09670 [Ramlibacter sp.]|nr:hypothetical protein [Ramlibacter sp.]MCW5650002.1 hypothetical protein [Ramlibacter sp.]
MSFLNQLKSQAHALQSQQGAQSKNLEAHTAAAEMACGRVQHYLGELSKQLNVLTPPGPRFSLDGKTPWPAMKLIHFRCDARKKMLRDREVFDYVGMGWEVVPQMGAPVGGTVSVNFPPDLERVEKRLATGSVKHERKEIRHPEKNTLLAIQFDYMTETRGYVRATPDHDTGQLSFRVVNANGFDVISTNWPADKVQSDLLDELAKLLVAQPSRFA